MGVPAAKFYKEKEMPDEFIQETTNDFVETFEDPKNQVGFFWRMIGYGELPVGVDPENEKVKVICKLAKESL